VTLAGFDTALATTAACVLRDDGVAFRTAPPSAERLLEPPRHSQELLPELERLLEEAGVGWDRLDSLAVGVGPGTFTGLRIGISTARALAQALRISIRPVSSLEALGAGIAAGAPLSPGSLVLPLIDARRGQVFAALYRVGEAAAGGEEAPALVPAWEPVVLDPGLLLERIRALPDAPVCAGDWAIKSAAELKSAGAEVLSSDSGLHAVDALYVCRRGMGVEPVAPEKVRPVYLRLPDAEVQKQVARDKGR
jgi:tRNA threonylcarbamoyladenosine biosynthesis protein TsaB